jgi:uncharacterized protein (TIRG00374 family)
MLKTFLRVLINTAIGIVLIYFWLKLVNLEEVWQALQSFNPLILIPTILLMALATISKALRFKILLSKTIKISSLRIINLTFLSQLLSFTIPVRLGEIAKGVYLSTHYDLHFGRAVVWVFLDRFLDFWAVLGLSLLLLTVSYMDPSASPQLVGIIVASLRTSFPQGMAVTLFFAVAFCSLLVIAAVLKPGIFKYLVSILSHLMLLKSLKKKFLDFGFFIIDCFSLLEGSLKRSFGILILTILGAFFEGLSWFIVLRSFTPDIAILKAWLGSMLNSLSFIIPAAPGYVGSAEAAGLAVFSYGLGMDKTIVSASTLIIHALSLIFILSSGILGLYMLKFNLGLVWKKLLKKN